VKEANSLPWGSQSEQPLSIAGARISKSDGLKVGSTIQSLENCGTIGSLAEWSIAPVLKTGKPKGF
jgi:hypothetical protein